MTHRPLRSELSPEEYARILEHERISRKNRDLGLGGLVPNDRVRKRLHFLMDVKGVTAQTIAERSNVEVVTVLAHYHGRCRNGGPKYGHPMTECRMDTERAILGAKFTQADQHMVPSHGLHRRIEALIYANYSSKFLAAYLGEPLQAFHRKVGPNQRRPVVTAAFFHRVAEAYEKLIGMDPEDAGVSQHGQLYAAALAKKYDYIPATCWDADTIDDPDAFPEWTGECGTEAGYYLHLKYDLRVKHYAASVKKRGVLCKPCREARSVGVQTYRKWSDEDRAAILAKVDGGATVRAVADEFGCSTRTVERFKRLRREAESSETTSSGDVS